MLNSFNTGVYFNAGMFYARIFNVLVPAGEHTETEEPVAEEPVAEEPVTEESAFIKE